MKKDRIKKTFDVLLNILILSGILFGIYPFISQYYYRNDNKLVLENFNKGVSLVDENNLNKRMLLAQAYNDYLINGKDIESIADPFEKETLLEGVSEYARMLEVNELIGSIKIPKISQEIPVYAGTSEKVLQKGAGHLEGTSLPIGGNGSNCVITAHRGLPQNRLFTDLDQLSIGDRFYYTNIKETIAYQIYDVETIEPHQFEKLQSYNDRDIMTLLTCTPYMINSHRLLVKGERIEYYPEIEKHDIKEGKTIKKLIIMIIILFIVILALVYVNLRKRKKFKELKNEVVKEEI